MHKWISNDNGDQCIRCGVMLDCGETDENTGVLVWTDRTEREEKAAHDLVPMGCNVSDRRPHHFVLIGINDEYGYGLECAYGDAIITATTSQVNNGPCIGA